MTRPFLISRCIRVGLGTLLLTLGMACASAASPKRVLILNSFEHEVAPFSVAASALRTTLAREFGEPLDFYEIPLDLARFGGPDGEAPLVTFLEGRIKKNPVDLVVTIGGAGMQFAARHRARLFPDTSLLMVAADPRVVPADFLRTNATLVTQKINLPGFVEDILQLQPHTTNIVVVFGASAIEKFWVKECRREFQSFTNRVGFTWLDGLTLEQTLARCAALPPRSFILHVLFVVDGAGIPCENDEALRRLHQVANAPLFGWFKSEFGLGPVGGRLFQDAKVGEEGARTAIRILRGEKPERIPPQVFEAAAPVYDWRELQRWGINEANLPTGSVIQFRQPKLWQQYRWHIAGVLLFCTLQTMLIIGLMVNRLARKRAEREMHESEERMTLAAEAAEFGVWVWNVTSNQVWGSETWRRLFGFASGENISFESLYERIHPEDRKTVEQEIKCAAADQIDHLREYRIILPDGTQRWIASRGRMQADATGTTHRMFGVAIEITERKKSETALRASEELNRVTFEQAAIGITHVGTAGRWLRVNDKFCAIVGYSRDELMKLTYQDITHPDDLEKDCNLRRQLVAGEIQNFLLEKRYLRKDQSTAWVELAVSLVRTAAGEPMHFISVVEDVTERKSTEAELLRQRAELAHVARVSTMGELAASVAHELNQPLGAILANAEAAELFLEQKPPALDDLRATLADIRKDDERASQVIRRMRDLLRKRELELLPIEINSLVEEVLQLVSGDAALRRISLAADLLPFLPKIAGDRIHLQQVLLNLILNGMDAMNAQSRERREILVRTRLGGDGRVELAVLDSGHGIEPNKLPRLFEPFFTTKPTGMGMGLSIARTIIEAHHGRIWAENNASGGAVFRITLPVLGGQQLGDKAK